MKDERALFRRVRVPAARNSSLADPRFPSIAFGSWHGRLRESRRESMNDKYSIDGSPVLPNSVERRAAAQLAEQERALGRQRALDSQSAWDATPAERIRRWEDLHALSLPRAAEHPLLAVIAAQTKLTLDDVKEEQQRRRALLHGGLARKEAT
jgi:hypothetical protein